jgi:signal transduction histidine kinase
LSACKEIIDEHRGRIRVDSTVGKGTEFIIRFPAIVKSETVSELP